MTESWWGTGEMLTHLRGEETESRLPEVKMSVLSSCSPVLWGMTYVVLLKPVSFNK